MFCSLSRTRTLVALAVTVLLCSGVKAGYSFAGKSIMCNICNPMTDALRGQILNAHNARRGSKLNWDCGLETSVDNYVKRCPGRSDPNQAGENFYRTSSGGLQCYEDWIDKAVNHWSSARKISAWPSATRLGCSLRQCGADLVVACRYSPTQSSGQQTPRPSGAIFDKGANTKCPGNIGMTDILRIHFSDTHMYRRQEFGQGRVPGHGVPKPRPNIYRLDWNCDLERAACNYVSGCPPSSNAEQNFLRVSSAGLPTFRDGIKKAVTEWWKVFRRGGGPSFRRIGTARHTKMGCCIGRCSSDFVSVCRYR